MGDLVKQYGASTPILERLESRGVKSEHFARLTVDDEYLLRVSQAFRGKEGPLPWKFARAYFTQTTFFGPGEWLAFFSVPERHPLLRAAPEFPWGEDVLESQCPFTNNRLAPVKETHVAFLGLEEIREKPLTILRWRDLMVPQGLNINILTPRYLTESFITEITCQPRWYLLYNGSIPDSTDKAYEQQREMLPTEYEVPFACEVVTSYCLMYTTRYVSRPYERCREYEAGAGADRIGVIVRARLTDTHQEVVVNGNSHAARSDIGVAASRKLPA
jgi:hypothetical protein